MLVSPNRSFQGAYSWWISLDRSGGQILASLPNGFEFASQGLALLPAAKGEAIAAQMHDAGLHARQGEDRGDGFGKALQSIEHRDQNVLYPAVAQLVHDL